MDGAFGLGHAHGGHVKRRPPGDSPAGRGAGAAGQKRDGGQGPAGPVGEGGRPDGAGDADQPETGPVWHQEREAKARLESLERRRRRLIAEQKAQPAAARPAHRERPEPGAGLQAEVRALDELRDQLAAEVEVERLQAQGNEQVLQERARLAAEIRALREQRQQLGAALETEYAEATSAHEAQLLERARLEVETSGLREQRRQLATTVEAEHAEAEAAYEVQHQEWERLHTEIRALHDYRKELAAAVDAERAEAEAAFHAQQEERGRLEAEIRALHEYREQLVAAVDVERATSGTLHEAQQRERARLEAEVSQLEAQVERRVAETASAEAGSPGPDHPSEGNEPLDASGRLAAAVADLGRHMAAVLEAERAEAERLARAQREARARLEAEIGDLEKQRNRPLLASGRRVPRRVGRRGRKRG